MDATSNLNKRLLFNFFSFRNTKSCKLFQAFYGQFVVNFDMEANSPQREALKICTENYVSVHKKDQCEIMSFVLQFRFCAFRFGNFLAGIFHRVFLIFDFVMLYCVASLLCYNFRVDLLGVPLLVSHLFPMYSDVH